MNGQEVITTTCSYDCGARCLLRVHKRNGKVSRISTSKGNGLNVVACPKGLLQNDVAFHKDRIVAPMLRIGKRGQGKFREISWEKAIDLVAEQIQKTAEKHGSESIFFLVNTGSLSTLHNSRTATNRFFGLLGRCTTAWCNVSFEGALQSSIATFGTPYTGCTRDNLLYSKLLILWGWDPLVTRFGSDTDTTLAKIKKSGVRIISVDPRRNKSCNMLADQWISIKPGTDAAMLISMAYVMIKEGIYDRDFVTKYTSGFDKFSSYVTGKQDGIKKNPEWAQSICGVPAEIITKLSREYAAAKPAALLTGWAPGRSIFGEQFHRAASVLAAMTGNIGKKGGFVSGGADFVDLGLFKNGIPVPKTDHNQIHKSDFYDAVLYGKSGNYPADCRILYIVGCNLLNQYLNLNKGIGAMSKPDFIVLHELFITPTARYADIIFPVTHFFENSDVGHPWIGGPYLIFMNKVTDPLNKNFLNEGPSGEGSLKNGPKSDLQIFTMLAEKIGLKHYNEKSDDEWIRFMLSQEPGFPDSETLRENEVCRLEFEKPKIAFREQIEDIEKHPFLTPSGKIEIFSSMFEKMNDPLIPPVPEYIPVQSYTGKNNKKNYDSRFPIALISPHSAARVNSQFDNVASFEKHKDDDLWINTEDARSRKIKNGDMVFVFNDNGRLLARAKVTEDIIPGVASLDQGQWHNPDKDGTDTGSCINVLTCDEKSPAGAFPSNTCFIQVEKALV
ncbi:MAG: hypothetical protein FJW66_03955 [Actinobacteria bacterium]|nr:hypothetical protein [Actinomycetota bacterium]